MLYMLEVCRVNQPLLAKVAFSLGGFLSENVAVVSLLPLETRLPNAPEALGG